MTFLSPLRKSRLLMQAADETNDAKDHDELHAAAVVCLSPVRRNPYVQRWISELVERVQGETVGIQPVEQGQPGE